MLQELDVRADFGRDLELAGLTSAVLETQGARLRRYLRRPAGMLSEGWALMPSGRPGVSLYVLGRLPPGSLCPILGQQLWIDRASQEAILRTFCRGWVQEIRLDARTHLVLDNRLVA